MHLVIFFSGTSDDGSSFTSKNRYLNSSSIGIIFVKGCDQPEVNGDIFFPNLKKFAERFVNNLFVISTEIKEQQEAPKVNLSDFKVFPSIGIDDVYTTYELFLKNPLITGITLAGYSRGGVTCFEVARELNKKLPFLPVDIVADQPVPGNVSSLPGTNAASILDCSDLKNLQNVAIIIGAYTGKTYTKASRNGVFLKWEAETSTFHRAFFSQVVPKFSINPDLIVIPRENHWNVLRNEPDGSNHMHMQLAYYLHKRNLIKYKVVQKKTHKAAASYTDEPEYHPALFPFPDQLQPIFGLEAKDVYKYLDKLHPMPKIRAGFGLSPSENLLSWWNRQELKHSHTTTLKEEKNLLGLIKKTSLDDASSLEILYNECDQWLMSKENRLSPRHQQVRALRDNVYYVLLNKFEKPKTDLYLLNRQNLAKTNYIYTHWKESQPQPSYSFSYLFSQPEKIDILDKAFLEHKKNEALVESSIYIEVDKALISVLSDWLASKESEKSRYRQSVVEIIEVLKPFVDLGGSLVPEEKEKPKEIAPKSS